MRISQSLWSRFRAKFKEGSESECWLWEGATHGTGHGQIYEQGRLIPASRLAYLFRHGVCDEIKHICYTCDIPQCVNPRHLFLGDWKSNGEDMALKGRSSRGEHRPLAKLTEEAVYAIRSSKASSYKLAELHGVSTSLIRRVRRRAIWRHI